MQLGKLIGTLVILGSSALVAAEPAQAVVQKRDLNRSKRTNWVTTELASRAHSDVQLRRLMGMFSAKKIEPEVLYQQLESLRQKQGRR